MSPQRAPADVNGLRHVPTDIGRLRRWEAVLDVGGMIAAGSEIVREVHVTSFGMLPVVVLVVAAAAARRAWPVPAAVAAILASIFVLFDPAAMIGIWVIAQICLFTVALRCSRFVTVVIGGIHATVMYASAFLIFATNAFDPAVLLLPAWTVAVVAAGLALRSNYDYVDALKDTASSVVAQRDADIARHIGEERLRIARDLHDSVAHTVSIVAVHAGAAERQLERDPARARDSLREVRTAAHAVTDELQNILMVLRSLEDDHDDTPVQAEGIPALVETARSAGLRIYATLDSIDEIDPAVYSATYRIVQESLTNALRYGTGEASIRLTRSNGHLEINVVNPVNSVADAGTAPGFGLIGMTERAMSVNGKVNARRAGESFVVHAKLPINWKEGAS